MLPKYPSSSYEAYKKDTNILLEWLSQASIQCGCISEPRRKNARPDPEQQEEINQHLKGKEKMETPMIGAQPFNKSKSRAEPKFKSRDLLKQVQVVVADTEAGVSVPMSIMNAGKRAVAARKRCAAWFKMRSADPSSDGASNKSHWAFIELLENILQTLAVHVYDDAADTGRDHAVSATHTIPSKDVFTNYFANLSMACEEAEGENEAKEAHSNEQPLNDGAPKTSLPQATYDLKIELDTEQKEEETLFAAYCLFEDFHKLRRFLKSIWSQYKHGDCDLATASVLTNTAFNMALREENRFNANFPTYTGFEKIQNSSSGPNV